MTKKRKHPVPAEAKPKRSRVHLDVTPEDRLKLLYLQWLMSKNKRQLISFSDLAHENWFRKMPRPPRNFKPPKRHTKASRNGASRAKEVIPDLAAQGLSATPRDKY